jgi:hypothetical protein
VQRQVTYQHRQVSYHREAAGEVRSTLEVVDLKQLKVDYQPLARAKLKVLASTVPSKRRAGKEETMKASMLMKTVAALATGAAFPLGAIAAQPRRRHEQAAGH